MKTHLWRVLLAVILITPVTASAARDHNPFLDYRRDSGFLAQSPSVFGGPAAGLFNPGSFAMSDVSEHDFWWNDRDIRQGLDNYGFAFGRTVNFAMNTTTFGQLADNWKIYDYQLGLAGGTRGSTFGLGYRWSKGERQRTPRENSLVIGTVTRAHNWLSFGSAATVSLQSPAAQYVFDLGIRPLGSDNLTVFADWSVNNDQSFFSRGHWGAGLQVRPVRGVHLGLRLRQSDDGSRPDYTGTVGLTWGFTDFTALPHFDGDNNIKATSYMVRGTPPFRGVPNGQLLGQKGATYYPINLENTFLTYQKYRYFDDKNVAWLDLLPLLNALRDDQKLSAVVINLVGFDARPSLVWEFRQKLIEIHQAGKEVIVYTDRTSLLTYYLAAAATSITIDPMGSIEMPGIALSRSYLKGTLAKLGIGFQAHRYFKYKSFTESFTHDKMSPADREQRQRIADVIYENLRTGLAESRGLTPAAIDKLIDDKSMLVASEALAAGLVDRIGRWNDLAARMRSEYHARLLPHSPGHYRRSYWDEQWGDPVKIPVVFAVGPCDMDSGIKGRATSAYLRSLVKDPTVKAVVLRADSPGGDVLPSDLIADAIRQLKAAGKPVIISQGDVAASGGYWISMDGTKILTTPLTITGSIGVIGGWVWDDGFAAKAGITSDEVHRGKHADLYSEVNLPFLAGIPRRPMNDEELARTEHIIRGMYDGFVEAVAQGRGMSHEAVHEIAQGRVWMGGDAVANGLCDGFGSLDDAINLARQEAGIGPDQAVSLVEYPPRPMFLLPGLGPKLPGLIAKIRWSRKTHLAGPAPVPVTLPGLSPYDMLYLQSMTQTRGRAAALIGPEMLPEAWQNQQ